jgi:integrase
MLQGLEQANITIKVDKEFFNTQVARYKENGLKAGMKLVTTSFTPSEVIQQLPYPSSLIAQLQYETGLRVSEAYAVLKNPEMHIDVNTLHSIQGKGGQIYDTKIISEELRVNIENFISQQKSLPNQSTYYRHLHKYDMRSHDFRAFYAKELYEKLKDIGMSDKEAYAQVSKEINHHRISITKYYLEKFEGN